MSRFLTQKKDNSYLEEIESMEICKWKINEVCCNDASQYLGDYPPYWCKCESKKDCSSYEKEDGIIEQKTKKRI